MAVPSASASIASRRSWIGARPCASIAASSMPVAQKSPTILATPVAPVSFAACSASWRCAASERSTSISNEPQLVRSPGIGFAASHLPLACASRSWQALTVSSRSASWKRLTGGSRVSSSRGAMAAVAAGAAVVPPADGAGSRLQAPSASDTASDRARILGVFAVMFDSARCGHGWWMPRQCTPARAGPVVSNVMPVGCRRHAQLSPG